MSAASVSWSLMTWAYTRSVAEPGGDHMHGDASQQQGTRPIRNREASSGSLSSYS